MLDIGGLTVSFGGVHAVHDVDLTVAEGEVVGLIGPNGAGKTTLIDAVTGFVSPAAGTVTFAGEDITSLTPAERARRGLVRTFQSLELFEDLSVRDNLRVAADPAGWREALLDVVRPRRPGGAEDDVDRALGVVGLEDVAARLPADLDHGQRKLVAVARALAGGPRLVLLDEPAAGLDADATERLGERLRALPDHGVTVLLVDHDMSLVLGVSDRVVVLDVGSVIADGLPAEIRGDAAVVEAYLGVAPA